MIDLRLVGLHVAIAIVILVIYLARRTPVNRRAWLTSLDAVGKRIESLEDCKDAEIAYTLTLGKQIDALRKERDTLQFENRVIQTDRTVLLVKNLQLQADLDALKAEK